MSRIAALCLPGGYRLVSIILACFVYTCLVCWFDIHSVPSIDTYQSSAAFSLSAVFALLLIFRNNSAYERWWEGRKLWGQLVNDSRNLAIKVRSFGTALSDQERSKFAETLCSFAECLKFHLRGQDQQAISSRFSWLRDTKHVPSAMSLSVYSSLTGWNKSGLVTDFELLQMDVHARALMDICGATERIQKSPIAPSYKLLLWIGLLLNLICMPWLLAPILEWTTLPLMLVSTYLTFGLEMLAEDVERPFDESVNDLPLDQICSGIRASVFEILTENTALPSSSFSPPPVMDDRMVCANSSTAALKEV